MPVSGSQSTSPPGNTLPAYTPPNRDEIWGEANTQAKSIYEPILKMIQDRQARDSAEARARSAASVEGATKAYAEQRPKLEGLYNSAIGQATAVTEAVSKRLAGTSTERGEDFAKRLAAMGAPETGSVQDLSALYSGATSANYAIDMNDVNRLVSRGAEARAYNEKAPLLFRQQSEADLSEALNELTKTYGDQSGEIIANVPGQVSELFDKLYGQRDTEAKSVYESKWERINYLNQQKKDALNAKIAAIEIGDKRAEAAARAAEKAIDQEIARLKVDATIRGQDITVRGQDVTARGQDIAANTADKNRAAGGGNDNDNVNTPGSAKQNRARQNAWSAVASQGGAFNKDILRKLKQYPKSADAIINTAINNSLKSTGVNPNSALGKSLRQEIRTRLGGRIWKVENGSNAGTYRFKP